MPTKGSRLDDRRDEDGELWPGVNAKPVALRRSVTASPLHSDTWDNRVSPALMFRENRSRFLTCT